MIKNFLAFIIMVFILTACNNQQSDRIRIGVLEGPSAISFVELLNNDRTVEGKKIEIVIKKEPQQIQAMMMQNEIDFAILPTIMAANLYNKGLKFKMIACPVWGTLFVVSNNPKLKSINNLSNKSIEVFGQGATPDILLQYMMDRNSIENVKYSYTYPTNNELANALLMKRIETAVLSEPLVSVLLSKDSSLHVVSKLECEGYMVNTDKDIFVQTAFLVNPKFQKQHSSLITKVSQMYAQSCNFVNEKPIEAAELLVKYGYYQNTNDALKSLPFCNIQYVGAFAIEQEIENYLSIFFKFDPQSIGGKIPSRDFIY